MAQFIWLPALSGFFIQLLNLIEAAKLEPARRPNFKDWVYWIPYFVGPILGGFVGYYSFNDQPGSFTALLGVQVGISAPLILKGLANAAAPTTPPKNPQ